MSFGEKFCAAVIIMAVIFLGKSVFELQHNDFGLKAQLTLSQLEKNYGFSKN